MLKREWKELLHNKMLLVVVVAIVLIPIIYAGFFLRSMWDPYGTLDHLPVAVVNKDQSIEYEGKTLKVGEDMVKELKENQSLAFNFVDDQVAEDGLRNGTYYMVITIPEDFSKNASTLMDDEPQKMELTYETNPGTNYIASKMSETAVARIKDSVATEVTKVYADTVFDQIATVGDGMQEAADGADKIDEGLKTASDGNATITDNLDLLATSTLEFREGAETLSQGLSDYTDGVTKVNDGAKQLNDGVGTLTAKVPELTVGTNQLNEGVQQYTDGVAQLNQNNEQLTSGTQALVAGTKTLKDGTTTLKSGAKEYVAGVQTLSGGVKQYIDGTGQLADGASQVQAGLGELNTAVGSLTDLTSEEGLKTLAAGLKQAKEGMDDASAGIGMGAILLDSGSVAIGEVSGQITDTVVPLIQSLPTAGYDLSTNVSRLMSNYAEEGNDIVAEANNRLRASRDSMQNALNVLSGTAAALKAAGDSENAAAVNQAIGELSNGMGQAQEVTGIDASAYTQGVQTSADGFNSTVAAAENTLNQAADAWNTVAFGLKADEVPLNAMAGTLKDGADQMAAGAAQIPSNIPDNPLGEMKTAVSQLYQGATTLTEGFMTLKANDTQLIAGGNELVAKGSELTSGASQVDDGAGQLATGAAALNNGVFEYTNGVTALNGNSAKLRSGTQELAEGAGTLASGATTLFEGTATLYDGTKTLVSNNKTLNSGANQLAEGAGEIHDGSVQLYDGSQELGGGMSQLKSGSQTLSSSLSDGAKEVKDASATAATTEMFASPVEETEVQMTKVPNNGHAMAPYMMSVGLWVGCLAFCLMYPLTKYKGKLKSGFSWWLSKASVLYLVAILQGIVLISLLHVFNDFTPVEMGKTIAFACLAGVTFTSIMYFFNVTVGKVGSFLMLVFMVIQLAGSAGTYPVEISPPFVAKIHYFLPFTYTVEAFRSTICGGESIRAAVIFLILVFLFFTGMTIAVFCHKAKCIRNNKPVLLDWLEEKGLA